MRDLEGSLKVFEPSAVLQLLNLAESTGELELSVWNNSATIFFERGHVTFASIANRPVKLGEYLVKEGLLKQKDLDKALKQKNRKKKVGDVLVESGAIEQDVLRPAVEEQIKEVIYEVVRWDDGRFRFVDGKMPDNQDVFIDIPLDHLMLEGLKRLDEEKEHIK